MYASNYKYAVNEMRKKYIKFKDVKAGMVIKSSHHYGLVAYIKPAKKYDSFFLEEPYVEMFSLHGDECMLGFSTYDPKSNVEVLTGEKREEVEKVITRSLRSQIHDYENYLRKFEVLVELSNPKKKKKK